MMPVVNGDKEKEHEHIAPRARSSSASNRNRRRAAPPPLSEATINALAVVPKTPTKSPEVIVLGGKYLLILYNIFILKLFYVLPLYSWSHYHVRTNTHVKSHLK